MGRRMSDVAGERGRIIPELAEAYNEKKSEGWKPRAKPGSLPASGVLGCSRRMALRVQGQVEPYAIGSPWLSEGQWHEREIIDTLRGLGYRITQAGEREGWFTTHIAGIKIRGQADGVLPEIPAVLEIKTVGTDKTLFDMWGPRDRWKVQAEMYMRALELPAALLFAKSRETGRARQWMWTRDDSLWKRINRHVTLVAAITDPWEHRVERKFECQWCPWKEKCWGEDVELSVGQDMREEA